MTRPGLEEEIGEDNADAPPFFQAVYRAVHRIPRGRVATYGDVAAAAGSPGAARAVGTAMSLNQDCSKVPCHRVVRGDGTVGLYGGGEAGVARKIEILREEGVEVDPATRRIRDFGKLRFTDLPGLD